MRTPIETAAEDIQAGERARGETLRTWEQEPTTTRQMYRREARDALASLARHRDGIARVLYAHERDTRGHHIKKWGALSRRAKDTYRGDADAVLVYLTREAS